MKVFLITGDTMGRGNDELGAALMANFLRKLWAAPAKPAALVFYNGGVRLLCAAAPAVEALVGLAAAGVDIVACGTCVGFFAVQDRLVVGRVSDMQEIAALLTSAESVVTV